MPEPDEAVYPGLWECGTCGYITDESHYFESRATGLMEHDSNPEWRAKRRDQCGWRSTYGGYHEPTRCALRHGHRGNHDPRIHGFGPFTEGYDAIPPAVHVDGCNA